MTHDPETLTGARVRALRERAELSRPTFLLLATGAKTGSGRLRSVEEGADMRPEEREAYARVLDFLADRLPEDEPEDVEVLHPYGEEDALHDREFADPETPLDDRLVQVLAAETQVPGPPDVFVDPDYDGPLRVSNSMLSTWRRCRRKWWLAYYRELALQAQDFTHVRATGLRIHRALAAYYVPDGETPVDPRDALERAIVEDWTEVADLATRRGVTEEQLATLADQFAAANNLERAMVEGYVQWLSETGEDEGLVITGSEMALSAELEVDLDGEPTPIVVVGKLDARAHRVREGVRRNLFVDHKSVQELTGPQVTLPQDPQMLHYHLLELLNSDPEFEDLCDGALYNMLRRVKRTARANPPFYQRVEVPHNPSEIESYKAHMLATSVDVLRAIRRLDAGESHHDVAYPTNTPSCKHDCDFFAVCNLFDDGSPGVDDVVSVLYERVDPYERYEKKGGPLT